MARDRTSEFISAVKLIEGKPQWVNNELRSRRGSKWSANGVNGHVSNQFNNYVMFMRGSRSIARDLYATYQKLEKINQIAKKKTIFDGDEASKELNELVYIVKQDITSLNQQIETLRQQQLQSSHHQQSNNIETHSKNVVLTLQQQLASMSNNFKNTLELRTQNMQKQKKRREQFTTSNSITSNSTLIDFNDDILPRNNSHYNLQEQQLLTMDQSNQYIEERASTMQSIESTIVELGTIFNQLATMVQQQEEIITRIDSNVTDTVMNVEAAHESLLRYFASVSNNRWLILKVFGVLFFFFIIFVLFAA